MSAAAPLRSATMKADQARDHLAGTSANAWRALFVFLPVARRFPSSTRLPGPRVPALLFLPRLYLCRQAVGGCALRVHASPSHLLHPADLPVPIKKHRGFRGCAKRSGRACP